MKKGFRAFSPCLIPVLFFGCFQGGSAPFATSENLHAPSPAVRLDFSENERMKRALHSLIQEIRTSRGLSTLTLDPALGQAAAWHSIDMATNDFVSHRGSNGHDGGGRLLLFGYSWNKWAENVGCASHGDPEQILSAWMKSRRHRAAILNTRFEDVGVGYAQNPTSRCRHFWTVIFGVKNPP